MGANQLDRRVEPIGVFALVSLVERLLDTGEPFVRDRAPSIRTSVVCSWFW